MGGGRGKAKFYVHKESILNTDFSKVIAYTSECLRKSWNWEYKQYLRCTISLWYRRGETAGHRGTFLLMQILRIFWVWKNGAVLNKSSWIEAYSTGNFIWSMIHPESQAIGWRSLWERLVIKSNNEKKLLFMILIKSSFLKYCQFILRSSF